MFEDIRKNKIKTGLIVSVFIIVVTLIVYYIGVAFDLGLFAVILALVVSITSAWGSYYYSDKIILSLNRARPATEEENKKLVNIFEALMLSSGLQHKPKLYIVEDNQPNAFATGRNPENSVVCVTTGLLDKLDYYELEGVIAHELSHIKNYDILLSAVITVMVGLVVMLADIFTRAFLWGGGRSRDSNNNTGVIGILIGLIFLILSPIFTKLMQLAISRRREYLADATAIGMTRNPDGLISALRKISDDPNPLEVANSSTESMYIVSPFRDKKGKKKRSNWFSTHPPIEDRIHAIENLR